MRSYAPNQINPTQININKKKSNFLKRAYGSYPYLQRNLALIKTNKSLV